MSTLPRSDACASAAPVLDTLLRAALGVMSPAGRRSRLSVVIFHRVLPTSDPMFPDDIDAARFDALCQWLAAWFNVLPLDEAVQRLASGSLPARALAITFDDGYADNHDVALPILQKHGLCATFFIATGFLNGGRMWNDTVVESVRGCGAEVIDFAGLGLPGIGRFDLSSPLARGRAVQALLRAIKYLEPPARQEMVRQVADLTGAALSTTLMMRSEQVGALAGAGMQIGAHTVSHPILARLNDADACREMAQSKDDLEALLGKPVTLFAYPNGKPGADYAPRDAALARRVGYRAAVSTAPGAARSGEASYFDLPRFTPWDQSRARFGARMLNNLRTA